MHACCAIAGHVSDSSRHANRHAGLEDETFAAIRKMAWISEKLDEPMANVALSWARDMPGITSLLMGARNQSQLERNLASLVRRKHLDTFPNISQLCQQAFEMMHTHYMQICESISFSARVNPTDRTRGAN